MITSNIVAHGIARCDAEKICLTDNESATVNIRLQIDRVLGVTKAFWFSCGVV